MMFTPIGEIHHHRVSNTGGIGERQSLVEIRNAALVPRIIEVYDDGVLWFRSQRYSTGSCWATMMLSQTITTFVLRIGGSSRRTRIAGRTVF
jgi:hypothetical protein